MKRVLPVLVCLALSATAAFARGFPVMSVAAVENNYRQARLYPVMDTLAIPITRTRGIYMIAPASGSVRAPIDSLLELWRNGGATPDFRKIQHLILMNNSVDEEQFRMTIFDTRGTSHFRWVNQAYQVLDLPIEADSIQIQADPTSQTDLTYIVW